MKARWVLGCIVLAASASGAVAKPSKAHSAKPAAATAPAAQPAAAVPADAAAGSAAGSGDQAPAAAPEEDPIFKLAHIDGPKVVDLGHGAEINVPAGMTLFEKTVAQQVLREVGNHAENTVALVLKRDAKWSIVIDADDVGYVSDDDAKDLDADGLLKSFKEGTAEQNKERVKKGEAELFVDGWSDALRYDKSTQQLVWGLNAHSSNGPSVNSFIRVLGRNGFLSVNLITSPDNVVAAKAEIKPVIDGLHYKQGSRYADHASGDKDSGLGLTALVLGGGALLVAKKTGLLVALVIFLKKGFIVVIAAVGAFFRKLFGKKKKEDGPAIVGAPGAAPQGWQPPDAAAPPQAYGQPQPPYGQPQPYGQPTQPQQPYGQPQQGGYAQGGDHQWPPTGNGGNNGGNHGDGNGGGGWPQGGNQG